MFVNSKKLLFISPGSPYPPTNGSAYRTISMALEASNNGWLVYVITDSLECYLKIAVGAVTFEKYPLLLRIVNRLFHPLRLGIYNSPVPSGEYQFYEQIYDPSWFIKAFSLAILSGIRVFQGEFPGPGIISNRLKKILNGRSIISLHNVEFERIYSIYPSLKKESYTWLQNIEHESSQNADNVITVSENDKKALSKIGLSSDKIIVVPNSIYPEDYSNITPILVRNILQLSPNSIILTFHGGYSYLPNIEAVSIIAEKVIPLLPDNFYLYAIGPDNPTETFHKRIFFTGEVKNIIPHIMGCDIAIVPLTTGGGTRLKILEYFAARIPVIASSKAVEGLSVSNENELIICDNFSEYAIHIKRISEDPTLRRSLINRAFEFANAHDWKSSCLPWLNFLNSTNSNDVC